MRVFHHTSGGVNADDRFAPVRLMRGVGLAFLTSPLVFAVFGICVWLLTHLGRNIYRAASEDVSWVVLDVVGCALCMVAWLFVTCLAVGHIVLMVIEGWKGSRA